MLVKKLVVGPLWTNCYIVASERGGEAAVIDPGDDAHAILEALAQDDLKVKYIVNTHGHFDHTDGNSDLKAATGAKLAASKTEKDEADVPLAEGQVLEVDGVELKVLETPGHTKGSISLLTHDRLFAGDLLFAGSIGRTDMPGGSVKQMMESLRKVSGLPGQTIVYPGHGPQTTIKAEKETNPFLQDI